MCAGGGGGGEGGFLLQEFACCSIFFFFFFFLGGGGGDFNCRCPMKQYTLSTLYILQNVSMRVCALSQTVLSLHPSTSVTKIVIVSVTLIFKLAT